MGCDVHTGIVVPSRKGDNPPAGGFSFESGLNGQSRFSPDTFDHVRAPPRASGRAAALARTPRVRPIEARALPGRERVRGGSLWSASDARRAPRKVAGGEPYGCAITDVTLAGRSWLCGQGRGDSQKQRAVPRRGPNGPPQGYILKGAIRQVESRGARPYALRASRGGGCLSIATTRSAGPADPGWVERIKLYLEFTRPFTLLPPTLGVISGAITAFGSASNPDPTRSVTLPVVLTVLLGSLCAALLNAASNCINQYYDIENDRRNKPNRPLVAGTISMRAGFWYAIILYTLAVLPTWLVVIYPRNGFTEKLFAPLPEHQCLFIYVLGMLATFIYSAPAWGRTKAHAIGANLTIAIPRGCLLKVAGWSMVASVYHLEPWYIGAIFGLFLLGAATTKDFSDMEGDRIAGCYTLPIRYGVRRAAFMIAPFFVLPWLLIPIGAFVRDPFEPSHAILTGNPVLLAVLGAILSVWGAYTVFLLVRNPDDLARVENHPSWTHMYLMMMAAQIGFAVAYLVPHP